MVYEAHLQSCTKTRPEYATLSSKHLVVTKLVLIAPKHPRRVLLLHWISKVCLFSDSRISLNVPGLKHGLLVTSLLILSRWSMFDLSTTTCKSVPDSDRKLCNPLAFSLKFWPRNNLFHILFCEVFLSVLRGLPTTMIDPRYRKITALATVWKIQRRKSIISRLWWTCFNLSCP